MDAEKILDSQFLMTDAGRIDRVRDLYTTFNHKVDLDALIEGGYIDAVGKMMEPLLGDFDDRSPKKLAYWAKLGMVKEFHGDTTPISWTEYEAKTGYHWEDYNNQGPQNFFRRWTSFVPQSAFRPGNTRKYPVVIALHGGFNPTSVIDGWGFPQEAARREWIVIVPSVELDDILEEILKEAKALYPIDETRVYVTGCSYGGMMSNLMGCKRPDLFAAVGPCGSAINDGQVTGFFRNMKGGEPMPDFDGVSRAKQKGVYMPIINVAGNLDGERFPLYNYSPRRRGGADPDPVAAVQNLMNGINFWCDVNDAEPLALDAVLAMKGREDLDEVEKNIGFPLKPGCGRKVVADGVTNYIADIPSRDGVARIRIMCEMNMPHWPTPEMSRQLFEFFSHFSRDMETLESVYEP